MTATDEAITRIKEMIVSGQVESGQKLPVEKELAMRFGVSRSSLREAVRALSLLGVLQTRQGDGTYVAELQPDLLVGPMSLVVELLQDGTLLDLLEVRRFIEPTAVAIAAAKIGDASLEALRESMRRMEAATSVEELVEADDAFHGVLVASSENPVLASLVLGLSSKTVRARIWRGFSDEEALRRTVLGHREIYEAVESRDCEAARAAATVHVFEVESWFRRALKAPDAPSAVDGATPLPHDSERTEAR